VHALMRAYFGACAGGTPTDVTLPFALPASGKAPAWDIEASIVPPLGCVGTSPVQKPGRLMVMWERAGICGA
jgi:hypothetical protein